MKIHISDQTREMLPSDISTADQKVINLKGKGEFNSFYVDIIS